MCAHCTRTARTHVVFAPTLTGLGERAPLALPSVNLGTHLQELHGVAACERLDEMIIVASSSGPMAATGFAPYSEATVRQVIDLDTRVPEGGQAWMDLMGPAVGRGGAANQSAWRLRSFREPD